MSEHDELRLGDVTIPSLREIDRASIATYRSMQADLERSCPGKWVALYRDELLGPFDDHVAAFAAVCGKEEVTSHRKIRRTWPYLILKVGDDLPKDREALTIRVRFPV